MTTETTSTLKKLSKYEPVPVLVERYAVLMLEVIADRDQGSLHYLATNLTSKIKIKYIKSMSMFRNHMFVIRFVKGM